MMDAHQKTAWPADRVERRAVASLVPYARNSRTHSPAQVDQIAASIRQWGWTTPVLVDEGQRPDRRARPRHGGEAARSGGDPRDGGERLERGTEARLRDRRQQAGAQRRMG